jgi:2-oxoglutarate ferredoxin oxidoreductase subunit alpha
VLLFPEDPHEAFAFAAEAFDLADRLQTPVFVMLDLDIGMNDWLIPPLEWDPNRKFDRGKVMTAAELEAGIEFGRYLDVDGDGIPYRTLPGTHPRRGAFFTRGTSKDRYARYSEEGHDYVDNMQRLLHKFDTAKRLVPQPERRAGKEATKFGVIYFGSTTVAMDEAFEALDARGVHLDAMRLRGFPFADEVGDFIADHERVFVVEQNRDAQMRTLLTSELDIDPAKLVPILHYDGTPITARFIVKAIADIVSVVTFAPTRKARS